MPISALTQNINMKGLLVHVTLVPKLTSGVVQCPPLSCKLGKLLPHWGTDLVLLCLFVLNILSCFLPADFQLRLPLYFLHPHSTPHYQLYCSFQTILWNVKKYCFKVIVWTILVEILKVTAFTNNNGSCLTKSHCAVFIILSCIMFPW